MIRTISKYMLWTAIAALVVASPASAQKSGGLATKESRRSFFMTSSVYDGSQAANACPAGFHLASVWELLDVSNLKYDTTLGFTLEDSGSGPPADVNGWIRNGRGPEVGVVGGNCYAWTSSGHSDIGSTAVLFPYSVTGAGISHAGPWTLVARTCANTAPVWCVQD